MAHRQCTSQYKTQIDLEFFQGEKELNEITAEKEAKQKEAAQRKEAVMG